MQKQTKAKETTEDKDKKRARKGEKTIVFVIDKSDYDLFIRDSKYARKKIESQIKEYPQLFPLGADKFQMNGKTANSKKMGLCKRKLIINEEHYKLHPSFVLPDMRSEITDDITKGMFLRAHGVPLWVVVYCFGRSISFWYNLTQSLSKNSIVGTTVYGLGTEIPKDIIVDEHHMSIEKQKHYIATTVGNGCILGAEVSKIADVEELKSDKVCLIIERGSLNIRQVLIPKK